MWMLVRKRMYEGRPFVCANETSKGKQQEDDYTKATSTSSHRHKQPAMPTHTLFHKHTHTFMMSQLENLFASYSLSNPPTHGNQQTHVEEQKKTMHCGLTGQMSKASYSVTTQTLLHVKFDKRSRSAFMLNER